MSKTQSELSELTPEAKHDLQRILGIQGGSGGVSSYNDLTDKPSINGVELQGDIEIETGVGDYGDLTNKPTINNVTVDGDKSLNDLGIASASVVNAIGSDVSQLDTRITTAEGDIASLESNVASVGNDVDVLEQRIDTAINAVTTDTEVTDIRVGADGTIYQTAGAAVRGQVTDLKSAINAATGTDADDVDLDITDTNGNVLARFADGHIQTKEFNSRNLPDPESIIDDSAGDGDTNKTWSANKIENEFTVERESIEVLEPTATSADVGKALIVKTVSDGKVTEYEFGEAGGTATDVVLRDSNAQNIDIDLTDLSGNVLIRFADGNIKTKNFDSLVDTRHLAGKKWTAIGDSLTEVNQRTTKHYHDYIAEATGITVVNLGHSGAGYYARPSDYSFQIRAGQVPLDSDVVTIFGSGNDVGKKELGSVTDTVSADTLCGYINNTLDILFSRFTTVNLGVITPTPWKSGSNNWTPENPENPMELYSNAIVEICRRRSIPCLDLYHCSNLRPMDADFRTAAYSKDEGNGIHPDETGHFLIAARFQAFLDALLLH